MYPTNLLRQSTEQAFRECYEATFGKVHAFFAGRIKNPETAKDLAHDLFLKLFQNWEKYEAANSPDAYLFALARNLLVDYYRKSLHVEHATDPATMDLPEPAPDFTVLDNEKLAVVNHAISQLPAQRQEAFRLKKLQGLTSQEVAEQMGLSKRTVENQVFRAVSTLRQQLAGLLSSFL